jgi:drug/metabolite transporter (DMT)-like permease
VTPRRRAYFAWVVVCLVWGTTYTAIRIALDTVPPFLMAGLRWTVAGMLLIAAVSARGEPLPSPRSWPALALLGVLLLGVGNGGVVWAELTVPSGLAAVLVAAMPFWMVGIEAMRPDRERLPARHVAGLVVGFVGIVLLVGPQIDIGAGRGFLVGVLSTQLACLGWAVGSSYARRRSSHENVLTAAAFEMLFGGLALLAVGVSLNEWRVVVVNPRTGGALLYLIVVGSIAGFSAYAYALKHLPVATVSLYAYVNPIIAVILGTLLLREPFTVRMALAAALIFAGVGLVRSPSLPVER